MKAAAVAVVYETASVGVRVALRTVAPGAEGTHEHFATKGVTVVVATASQPTITVVPTEKATLPGAPAVATMIAGSRPNTVLPPDKTRVGAVAAAKAEELPTIALPARARATIRALVDFLFISLLLLVVNYF